MRASFAIAQIDQGLAALGESERAAEEMGVGPVGWPSASVMPMR
jgi:hypothetical protein